MPERYLRDANTENVALCVLYYIGWKGVYFTVIYLDGTDSEGITFFVGVADIFSHEPTLLLLNTCSHLTSTL